MSGKKVREIMTPHPTMIAPDETIAEAAKRMQSVDCGCLPVGSDGDVLGIITDRDIALRVVAQDRDPKETRVQDAMSKGVYTVKEDDDIEHAADEMRERQVARLVVTSKKHVTGIITMAGILREAASHIRSSPVLRELATFRLNHHATA